MKRGFPRPMYFIEKASRHGGYGKKWNNRWYPHPYTASDGYPANINQQRLAESVYFKKCGTCGEPVKEELVGLILNNRRSPVHDKNSGLINSESGPYHLKCLSLNFTVCPHLVETKQFIPAVGLWKDVRADILKKVVT